MREACALRQRPRRRFPAARRGRYGTYSYSSPRWTGASVQALEFNGTTSFADLLAGYHKQLGPFTIKFLAGLTVVDQNVDDPEAIAGTEMGAKAIVETWWNVTDRAWSSIDLSWTTLHNNYGARARLGWRVWPALSLGIEGAPRAAGSMTRRELAALCATSGQMAKLRSRGPLGRRSRQRLVRCARPLCDF